MGGRVSGEEVGYRGGIKYGVEATAAVGTHPNGMLSCFINMLFTLCIFSHNQLFRLFSQNKSRLFKTSILFL